MSNRVGVAIAGTHGKRQPTAMLGWILHRAGHSPRRLRRRAAEPGRGGWAGAAKFRRRRLRISRSFLAPVARHAAILNIEPDHFDCYRRRRRGRGRARFLAQRPPSDGVLLCLAQAASAEAAACAGIAAESTRFASRRWPTGRHRRHSDPAGQTSSGLSSGRHWSDVRLHVAATPQRAECAGGCGASRLKGVAAAAIRERWRTFAACAGDSNGSATWRGVEFIDDYAHHPTAVAATLRGRRDRISRPTHLPASSAAPGLADPGPDVGTRRVCAADQILISRCLRHANRLKPRRRSPANVAKPSVGSGRVPASAVS